MKPALALAAFLLGALLLTAAPAWASSPYRGLPADLEAAVEAYDAAQVNGDRAELERLVADDYVLVSGGGVRQGKAQLIADYLAPGFKLDPFTIEEPVQQVWGTDSAILGGRVDMQGTDGGRRFRVMVRFADVWARRDGRWRVVYSQVTRVPAQP